ncbi:MAG: helix-hairpin-helix domain-containing protein [candidate division Zixibacteria bacterium]|nr:helix-hairpin-helix domain-containing protein [candidate division Zixibacteria bacterium]MBU1469199.1 helix-hairpin-helix domain-containing protein [candidate division Zixibacteria bacterium]MBU2626563.1 helix-hairpin-helix domain-containing protein [candidate division Zixibacteria bacterium]
MNDRRPELFSKSDIRVVLFLTTVFLVGGAIVIYQKSGEVIYPEVIISQLEQDRATTDGSEVRAGLLTKGMLHKYRININTAPIDSLVLLPGIGNYLATKIIESRKVQGRFESVDDLVRVKGIGPSKLTAVRGMIEIGEK